MKQDTAACTLVTKLEREVDWQIVAKAWKPNKRDVLNKHFPNRRVINIEYKHSPL